MAGNIGVGKSTFTSMFAQRHNYKVYYEVVDENPYLADFYADMKRWSFHLQVFFLNKRFAHHMEIQNSNLSTIQDRSIWEDAMIFAKNLFLHGNMSEKDYYTYIELFNNMVNHLKKPDLLVYLKGSISTIVHRINKRGRTFEKNMDVKYLEQLNDHYDSWERSYDGNILTIDTDGLDFVKNTEDFDYMNKMIMSSLEDKKEYKKASSDNVIYIR